MTHLVRHGNAWQLDVGDQPFLVLGGELHNSTASSASRLAEVWPRLVRAHLNTVLVPVYWELVEPEEGQFDFRLLDAAVTGAREHGLSTVLLWFGSWKNSMSSYVPPWVKRDDERFPRVRLANGEPLEILSAFSTEALAADQRAYAAVMRRVRELDPGGDGVLMVQVENEVGMLGDARERGDAAEAVFASAVPERLLEALVAQRGTLTPELAALWAAHGEPQSGTWAQVFGDGPAGAEVFTAWHYARWIDALAEAGKREHPIPAFVNAALAPPGKLPGQYPSGGPLPHLIDVWKAGAPNLDFLSPDIYFPDFERYGRAYARRDNALFVPEAKLDAGAPAHACFTIGELAGIGFSPFAIDGASDADLAHIGRCYELLGSMSSLILEHQAAGTITGVVLDQEKQSETIVLGDYALQVRHDWTFPWAQRDPDADAWPRVGALMLALGSDEMLVAGGGVIVTFESRRPGRRKVGILSIDEGEFRDGEWIADRRLNGDESHQGRHLRIPFGQQGIQRIRLYTYG